ncbi:MAG TPA: VIT1/CCC1 transporter family protein [Candidatus Saccharimonadales bacterium]|nr:VIT1/CCC1 transporter family protein [Candidatus Saccharimonadales bacterium]
MDRNKDSEILARRSLQVQRGAARAAVLGVNDGLVSTLCIVLTVAGAGAASHNVLLAGFAGLIAGAVSMAAGEWISVQAQVELFGGILKDVKKLIVSDRALLIEQVTDSLSKTGHEDATAKKAANEIAQSDEHLMTVYARQVMGFNPDELGSPWMAAGSSFALFTLGALAPLSPWFFGGGAMTVWLSIIFTAIGGLVVGGYISVSSGKSATVGALRQLGIIILASVVTYGVGYLFGVSVN